ncbi:family 78 glycoside hydrolase catalytic domain [Sediminitomix flava]|uniref:alpha-L-rhamnosidase n=1 Tax=Sediminitomix flava TaxID=379075 RepID=A0A315Z9J0_SEDFL|nr:family 78 glycoside hydrolase catalytic domain [Sediminitomix flava]PWJ42171.1 alpha-L-rhamnosidase-like protein [Sediminitomix flava]
MLKQLILLFSTTLYFTFHSFAQKAYSPKAENFEHSIITPKTITELKKGHYLIDFGKAYFGTLQIQTSQKQGKKLIIDLGEKLNDQNRIDKKPGGYINYCRIKLDQIPNHELIDIAIPEKYLPRRSAVSAPKEFQEVIPFRYCEIQNLQIPIESIKINLKALHYSFNDHKSSFTSSDTILNQIWDLCKHTIKATSFTGYYIDGHRERKPYEADAFINQLSHYCVDTNYDIAQNTNQYFIDNPTWPTEWILHTAKLFYTDYLYSGDTKYLKENYEKLKARSLIALEREDGLISTSSLVSGDSLHKTIGFKKVNTQIKDIVDWPAVERNNFQFKPYNTVVNAFYYENLSMLSLIASTIGKKDEANFYLEKAKKLKESYNDVFFDEKLGIYKDGEEASHYSLHANFFSLAMGLVPKEHTKTVIEFIKEKEMSCSVYGAQYLLETLLQHYESEYALQLITETKKTRSWWNMIEAGSTMTMEVWDKKYKENLDWNHAWGTAPLNIITRNLWGIKPTSAGFKIAEIKPQLHNLKYSTIKVPTLKGEIIATYNLDKDGNLSYEFEIPNNMTAIFHSIKNYQILYNGFKINDGKIELTPGKHSLIELRNKSK